MDYNWKNIFNYNVIQDVGFTVHSIGAENVLQSSTVKVVGLTFFILLLLLVIYTTEKNTFTFT